jgi:Lon protease-like protein
MSERTSDEHAPLTEEELSAIALFPLPRLVLLPGTTLPLHVFEARYRAMIADCMSEPRMCLVVVQLRPGHEASYEGRPPIYRVGGAGRITACRQNPDGTYDIAVEAQSRVALTELPVDDKPYRRAQARVLADSFETPPDRNELSALWSLAAQVTELVRKQRGVPVQLLGSASAAASPMIDSIADQLIADPLLRQTLLETQNLEARLALTKAYLAKLHLALLHASKDTPGTLH